MIPPLTTALLLMVAAVLVLLFLIPNFRERVRRGGEYFANALIVNVTAKGRATRLADAAFTERYMLCKAGSDASHIAIAGVAVIPLAVVPDMTPTTDVSDLTYPLPVNFLGLNEDTERMIASAAIAIDAFVVAAASGRIRTLPGTTGTYYIIG